MNPSARVGCCALALLLLARTGGADEPKKEPEKKKPATPAWLETVGKAMEIAQKLREAEARRKSAENLRQLGLRLQQSEKDTKKDPPKSQPAPDSVFQHLLPYIEQDNLYLRSALFNTGGHGDRLGVPLEHVAPPLAHQLKLPKDQGRLVGEVKKGSPAEKAGLRQHDILLEINGKAVPASDDDLGKLLPDGKDAKAAVTVLREGKRTEIKDVPVGEKATGASNRIFLAPSDNVRAWEWHHLARTVQPGPEMPRGYEILAREPLLTTVFREDNRFTVRLQEGTLAITVVGKVEGKKTTVEAVKVQEGTYMQRFNSVEQLVPEYRDKAARLLRLGEKSEK